MGGRANQVAVAVAMIDYDEGKWGILFAFSCKGSAFPRACVWAGPCAIFSAVLNHFLQNSDHLKGTVEVSANLFRGFLFVLGFLIVFRSQKAYARWWEGGTLLQQLRGEWFNAFSSLLAFCNQDPKKQYEVEKFSHQLARLMSLLYVNALKQVSTMKETPFELIDLGGFDMESLSFMQEAHDSCEITLQWMQRLIVEVNGKDVIKIAPPILSRVYNQLGNGIVKLNNVRKIREFPIPFPITQMITVMLLVNWVVGATVCAMEAGHPILAAIFTFIVQISF